MTLPVAPLVACLAAGWLALLLSAPWLPAAASALTYVAGGLICHQFADRSFHVGAVQLPVCARCLGIYGGVLFAAAWLALRRPGRDRPGGWGPTPRAVLAIGLMPTAVSVVVEWTGLWQTSNAARFVAGAPLGAAAALIVLRAWPTLHYGECASRPPAASSRPPSHI